MKKTYCRGAVRLIIVVILFFIHTSFAMAEIVFVANSHVSVSQLTLEEIREIFTGRQKKWPDNKVITVAVLRKMPAYQEFTSQYTNKTTAQYMNWWKRQVFTGTGRLPKFFKDEIHLVNYLEKTDGAIGFISTPLPDGQSLKIITITQ